MSLQAGVQRVQESALRSHSQFVQELRWAPTASSGQGLGVLPSPLWCHLQGRGTFTMSREDPPGLGQTLGSRLGPCTEARGFQGCHLGLMALGLSGREGPRPSPPHVDVTGFLPSLSLSSLSACFSPVFASLSRPCASLPAPTLFLLSAALGGAPFSRLPFSCTWSCLLSRCLPQEVGTRPVFVSHH